MFFPLYLFLWRWLGSIILMSLPLGVPSFKSLFAASDSLRTFTNDIRTFGELYWHLIV